MNKCQATPSKFLQFLKIVICLIEKKNHNLYCKILISLCIFFMNSLMIRTKWDWANFI